jgi:hypothetical protein
MANHSTVFRFESSVAMGDVEATLTLSKLAAASLHGDDRVRLQARARIDHPGRACEIDMSSAVGQDLALIFGGYVRREFGDAAVQIECAESDTKEPALAAGVR